MGLLNRGPLGAGGLAIVLFAFAALPLHIAAQEAVPGARREIRILLGVNDPSLAVEGDVATWEGISLVTSVQRWPSGNFGCIDIGTGPGLTPTSPACSPEGWGLAVGLRAVPHPRDRVGLFLQGDIGGYRYDGGGILTPSASGRVGFLIELVHRLSLETGMKMQWMASYDWGGVEYRARVVAAWQAGLGIQFG